MKAMQCGRSEGTDGKTILETDLSLIIDSL